VLPPRQTGTASDFLRLRNDPIAFHVRKQDTKTTRKIKAPANPAALATWQGLDTYLGVIEAIGRIAAQFGPRTGDFPAVSEYALADNYRLDDRAFIATGGPLETDSAAFRRPDQGHRTSPWCRVPLRLHSVESGSTMTTSYRRQPASCADARWHPAI